MSGLRIGVIGCGQIVENAHLPAYAALPFVTITGLLDADGQRSRLLAGKAGLPADVCVADVRGLLARGVDVVVVATPSAGHAATVRELIELGVPSVLCEKPLALDGETARELTALATSRGVGLAVVHNYRTAALWTAVDQLITDGLVGRPERFSVHTSDPGPYPGAFAGNEMWRGSAGLGGRGCLMDQGYHFVYLAEHLLRAPISGVVSADIGRRSPRWSVEDHADVELAHTGGGRTRLRIDWLATDRFQPRMEVNGSAGDLVVDEDAGIIEVRPHNGAARTVHAALDDPHGYVTMFDQMLGTFAQDHAAVRTNDAQRCLDVLDRCYALSSTPASPA